MSENNVKVGDRFKGTIDDVDCADVHIGDIVVVDRVEVGVNGAFTAKVNGEGTSWMFDDSTLADKLLVPVND